jgi:hypothetical protein
MALRKLCWETMFGQELVKLTIMDTLFLLLSVLIGDFFRSTFLRYRHAFPVQYNDFDFFDKMSKKTDRKQM